LRKKHQNVEKKHEACKHEVQTVRTNQNREKKNKPASPPPTTSEGYEDLLVEKSQGKSTEVVHLAPCLPHEEKETLIKKS